MIAASHLKSGKAIEPIEETKSAGAIAFAFKPGGPATIKITTPPQSFCLLFEVPATLKSGQIVGLGAAAIALAGRTARRAGQRIGRRRERTGRLPVPGRRPWLVGRPLPGRGRR